MGIAIGRYNTLEVVRMAPPGAYLGSAEEEVLLPNRFVPSDLQVGDSIRVFVYTDSEDRPVATTQRPQAVVGDFAYLRVVDAGDHGAFLDWGLDKDLFAPFAEQWGRIKAGDERVFAVSLDREGRVMASSQLRGHFDYDVSAVRPNDEVELLVYGHNDLGAMVVVDGRHTGLVYKNESYRPLSIGDRLSGFVHAVREDNKLDIRLQRKGRAGDKDAESVILDALRASGGFLPLHDRSSPDEIRAALEISKKAFKRALGGLYKKRLVKLSPEGTTLLEK